MITVVVRADASLGIGTGHVMRCLTLADELRATGAHVHFVCRDSEGNVNHLIAERGFDVHVLPASSAPVADSYPAHAHWLGTSWLDDARQTAEVVRSLGVVDWLIVDHYALEERWETHLKTVVDHIMVIDDLADRAHKCEVLLDQNLYEQAENRYAGLIPDSCRQFHGPAYALLRPEFREARMSVNRDGVVRRVLVFLGGADQANITARALRAVRKSGRSTLEIDVVVGAANPHREEIRMVCSSMPGAHFYCSISNMAKLMAEADFAIGAGGTTTWERCCVGLPAIVLIVADNQREVTQTAHRAGLVYNAGEAADVTEEILCNAMEQMIDNPAALRNMARAGMALVDGQGACRIARVLLPIEV